MQSIDLNTAITIEGGFFPIVIAGVTILSANGTAAGLGTLAAGAFYYLTH